MSYADGTKVPAGQSRLEIEKTVINYKASNFWYGSDENKAMIAFVINGRRIKFVLPMPDPEKYKYRPGKKVVLRSPGELQNVLDQSVRQRWRALALAIKAKLETVASGISTFEVEFMPYTVMPDGSTASEHYLPQIAKALEGKRMPPLLGQGGKAVLEG